MKYASGPSARSWRSTLIVSALMIVGCQGAESQAAGDVHPAKQIFTEYTQWPATAPGEVSLSQFTPFRAVYHRNYTDANGAERNDRVIVTAEHVAWDDEGAIAVGLIDAGSLEYTDTSARKQTRFFAEGDLRLLLQLTPASGTAKDYVVIRVDDGAIDATQVESATGETQHREMPLPSPSWGAPGAWVVGSMPLAEGMKIRLDPYLAMGSSSILGTSSYHVTGQESVSLPNGETSNAWVVEYPLGMTNGRIMQLLILDRPPYLFAKRPYDADTGETSERGALTLLEYQAFESHR